ncbi:MAG: hypothetical protein ACU0AY_01040 [Marinibacterium profundimaris]
MKAWIIKWDWIGDHAAVKQPIVAILSARKSPETVRNYVELLYGSQQSLHDQRDIARYNKPRTNPYPAEFAGNWAGAITCGHNPFLEAFLADDVKVLKAADGTEDVVYVRRKLPAAVTKER